MAPNPINCSVPDCDYSTPPGIPTYELITQQLALHTQSVHAQPAGPAQANVVKARVDKQSRPESKREMTEHEFAFFTSQWARYKRATAITGQLLIDELWATMGPDLQQLCFDQGGIDNLDSEALMMERIKSLAVTVQHKAVHTVQLHNAKQQPHESVKAFSARVRGLASNCGLKKKCSCVPPSDVSYLEETVHSVVLAGLKDRDLQEKCTAQALLGNINDIQTLVAFCTAEESGRLGTSATISALRKSTYRKEKGSQEGGTTKQKCKWCGDKTHSGTSPEVRAKECAAYKQTCAKCNKPHHLAKVCRQPASSAALEQEAEVTPQTASFGFYGIMEGSTPSPPPIPQLGAAALAQGGGPPLTGNVQFSNVHYSDLPLLMSGRPSSPADSTLFNSPSSDSTRSLDEQTSLDHQLLDLVQQPKDGTQPYALPAYRQFVSGASVVPLTQSRTGLSSSCSSGRQQQPIDLVQSSSGTQSYALPAYRQLASGAKIVPSTQSRTGLNSYRRLQGKRRRAKPAITGREEHPKEWEFDHNQGFLGGLHQHVRVPLCHMEFTAEHGWQEASPPGNPTAPVTISAHLSTYSTLGLAPPTSTSPRVAMSSATIDAIADSGAQMNIISARTLAQMQISEGSLLPVKVRVHGAVQGSKLQILGGIFLHVADPREPDKRASTTQMFYVASNVTSTYLSLACLKALGIVDEDFPRLGQASLSGLHTSFPTSKCENTGVVTGDEEACSCPKRELPPQQAPRLPCSPTEENLPTIKRYILDRYKASAFNTCERQALPLISGSPPLELHVDPDAKPVACHVPIPLPLHWQATVKAGLDRDVALGVLEKVPPNVPTKWLCRMLCVPKHDGSPRRVVDYGPVNAHCPRQTHHTPSPWHLAASVPEGTRKTVMDNWHGYHSLPLATEADRNLTTFITPWGRFRYRTSPQGLKPSGDGFTDRMDALYADFERSRRCVDDTLLYDDTIEAQFYRTCEFLDRAGHHGIILNPEKFQFAETEVDFLGFRLTATGPRPSDEFLNGIRNFPTPANITDVRSWFGAINQISYSFATCSVMEPFRHLLGSKAPFAWSPELDAAFQASKEEIVRQCEHGVRTFDPQRRTCLATDWSKTGIGFWLCQQRCNCSNGVPGCCKEGWQTVYVGSRFCTGAEQRYAPIEGEAMAAAWATNKCKYFLLGLPFLLAVDHKPLLPIFSTKALDVIANPRIRNQRVKLLSFNFTPIHVAGKANVTPDTFSRRSDSPVGSNTLTPQVDLNDISNIGPGYSSHLGPPSWVSGPTASLATLALNPPEVDECDEEEGHLLGIATASLDALQGATIASLTRTESVQAITWPRLQEAASKAPLYQDLATLIGNGAPEDKSAWPASLVEYHPYRSSLLVLDGVVMCGERPVIPAPLRSEVLETLHAGHAGVTTMLAKATQAIFWPSLRQDLIDVRAHCRDCTYAAPSNPAEPPQPPVEPDFPFSHICMDFFQVDATYLAIADRYTNWLSVFKLPKDDSYHVIEVLRQYFARWGIAKEVTSDGAAVFTSAQTEDFLARWGVTHRVSSAYYPRANKRAELAVKAAKRLVMGNLGPKGTLNTDSFARALLEHRNTVDPITQLSPAMIIFGRELKGFLPALMSKYQPRKEWRLEADLREQAHAKRHAKMEERLSAGTRELPPLTVGDTVVVQDQSSPNKPGKWTKTGVVIETLPFHSYMVRMHGSRAPTQRNRRFLRKIKPYSCLLPQEPCTLPTTAPVTRSGSPTTATPPTIPPVVPSTQPMVPPPTLPPGPPSSQAQSTPGAASPPSPQQPSAAKHRLQPAAPPGSDAITVLRERESRGHHLALRYT